MNLPGCLNSLPAKLIFPVCMFLFTYSSRAQNDGAACQNQTTVISATHLTRDIPLNAARPVREWKEASPVTFCSDWQGKNADPERQTTVRVLWSDQTLYLHFDCKFRELHLFDRADTSAGRKDHLWDRDVAEAFLQPDPSKLHYYKEFEVSPNGYWIDLDINLDRAPSDSSDLNSGLRKSTHLDRHRHTWSAELAIPIKALTKSFDPAVIWHANFFRVEGQQEPRFYSSWQPTKTPQPNFHVPAAFGELRFTK